MSKVEDVFFAWQCRIRQEAMRGGQGRPSEGMVAKVMEPKEFAGGRFVFLLHRGEEGESYITQFRHIVRSSYDPREKYERGLKVLAGGYFQNSDVFLPVVTAVFPRKSKLGEGLIRVGHCRFSCYESAHGFEWYGGVEEAGIGEEMYEGSIWHNRLFREIGGDVRVVVLRAEEIVRTQN